MNPPIAETLESKETFVISAWLRGKRKTSVVLLLALLPWACVSAAAAGLWVALDLVVFAALSFLAGYAVLSAVVSRREEGYIAVLAPAGGVLALSALTAFWLRLGLPLDRIWLLWLLLAVLGAVGIWRDRIQLRASTVEYGFPLVILSALICAIYFVPGAFNDAVLRPDGSFSWLSLDTQLYHSMVASIKNSVGLPKMAGTFSAPLCYHFGPYAVAAGISTLTGMSTGDALVRVTRGVEQWALVFSCLGLGTLLSIRASARAFGGFISVAGLFFYGSMLSLFSGFVTPRPVALWPILFEAGGQFPTNGGPFSHFLLGTSLLHGMEALTVIMALCIAQRDEGDSSVWRTLTALTLPALVVAVHSACAAYCIGVVAVLLFWGHLSKLRTWLLMAVMLVLFLGACWLMGFGHAPHVADATIELSRLPIYWWSFLMWFVVALGIRVISFGWVTRPGKDPIAVLVPVSFVGLLAFSWIGNLWAGTEHYGLYYLQAIFSVFAFSRMPSGFWRNDERRKWTKEWLSFTNRGLLSFTIFGILVGVFGYAIHRAAGIPHFRPRILICLFAILIATILSVLMDRKQRLSAVASAIIAAALFVGFLGWIPPWFKYRTGGQSYNVTLTPGEVRGLERLHDVAASGDRFATNKHIATAGAAERWADSYAYGTVSGLPVLLEGSYDGAEQNLAGFANLQRENDLLFDPTDPNVLKSIAESYRIRWLVLRPGTDLNLPKPLPSWLVPLSDSGDLKIYRIDQLPG